mgnify:CR=1 FL=1
MPGKLKKELTARQQQVLELVKSYTEEHGVPPTVREIGSAIGIKGPSVCDVLHALERKGRLRRQRMKARSLVVAEAAKRRPLDAAEIRVIGRIAAGGPTEAVEGDLGSLPFVKGVIRSRGGFALRVVGDSMIEAGIMDGDYVIIRHQETAEEGDIVVALVNGEVTLKRLFREADGVRLEPANPNMAPIHVTSGDFTIQGKVVGVLRVMNHR